MALVAVVQLVEQPKSHQRQPRLDTVDDGGLASDECGQLAGGDDDGRLAQVGANPCDQPLDPLPPVLEA